MNASETAQAKKEIRALKSSLAAHQKRAARDIKKYRTLIRKTEKEITLIERESSAFLITTTDRLAILDGRLNS